MADDPDQFEEMPPAERLIDGLPVETRVLFRSMIPIALPGSDFGVFASDVRPTDDDGVAVETSVIMSSSIRDVVQTLVEMVEQKPHETAQVLAKHGGNSASLGRIVDGLNSGTWPASGDPRKRQLPSRSTSSNTHASRRSR